MPKWSVTYNNIQSYKYITFKRTISARADETEIMIGHRLTIPYLEDWRHGFYYGLLQSA